jgi:ribonuclease J
MLGMRPVASLRVIALGGLGEVGMNCLALEQRGEAIVVDCGVTFDGRGLGVDVVHPDFTALEGLRVVGLFLTHGHEDHIGAVPYFLKRFDVPVYGGRYALGLLRARAEEHEVLAHADLREVAPRSATMAGSFHVEPVRVTHSIADATSLAIRTDAGLVVHTGDFKFDEGPPDEEPFDVPRFEELSREGVRLLMSDSTNVDAAGTAGGEAGVGDALESIVAGAGQAVVVGVFASNVHRLRMLGEIAGRYGRKLVLLGRSVGTHSEVARGTRRVTGEGAGRPYLDWPSDLVWPVERARELPKRAILGLATGTQGEAAAALARLGRGDHRALDLGPGDVVVLSSRVIPGNEAGVMRTMADLLRRGVEVRSWWSDRAIHVSGHAHRVEQRRMIDLVRPRGFIPLHGTLHHLTRHAALAREAGIDDVCVLENGDVCEVGPHRLAKAARVRAGRVHVVAARAVPDPVLEERMALASRGMAQIVVPVDERGRLTGEVILLTCGVLDAETDAGLVALARAEAAGAVEALRDRTASRDAAATATDGDIADAATAAVRRRFGRELGFRPVLTAVVLRTRAT